MNYSYLQFFIYGSTSKPTQLSAILQRPSRKVRTELC